MRQIVKNIKILNEQDDLNKLLYFIYLLSDDKEYSYLSELIYALDKDSLLNFCSIFGGCTIKVPTLSELQFYTKICLLFQLVSNGSDYETACNDSGLDPNDKKVKELFLKMTGIFNEYENAN